MITSNTDCLSPFWHPIVMKHNGFKTHLPKAYPSLGEGHPKSCQLPHWPYIFFWFSLLWRGHTSLPIDQPCASVGSHRDFCRYPPWSACQQWHSLGSMAHASSGKSWQQLLTGKYVFSPQLCTMIGVGGHAFICFTLALSFTCFQAPLINRLIGVMSETCFLTFSSGKRHEKV